MGDQKYITFDGMKVNIGGAMDPDSGMFKAPVPGVYSFSFHGLTQDGTATYVKLVHRKMDETEWENVAGTYRRHEKEEDEQTEIQDATKILKNAEGMMALHSFYRVSTAIKAFKNIRNQRKYSERSRLPF